jgi:hypothetical protein
MPIRSWRFQWLGLAVLAAAVLGAVAVAQSAGGSSLLRNAGLTSAPARYTELSFLRPTLLPEKLPHGKFVITAPFTLHNAEGADHTYDWIVQEIEGAKATTISSGRSRAPAGEVFTVNPHLRVTCRHEGQVRIAVRISNPAQSIGWWAHCLPPGREGA